MLALESLHRHRPSEQVALEAFAAVQLEETQLARGFHAFGHDLQVEALGQRQDGADDGRIVGVGEHIAHEALVDLDQVEGQALEVAQRRVPGTEIVQREPYADPLELRHAADRVFHVAQQQAFGELELEPLRIGPGGRERSQHLRHEIGLAELPRAHVHRDGESGRDGMGSPAHKLLARGLQHLPAQREDEAGLLGERDEVGRAHQALHGMPPAHQRFRAAQARAAVHDGLQVHGELLPRDALAKIRLQLRARRHLGLHVRIEEPLGVPPGRLGLVHGEIGALEQLVHAAPLVAEEGDADAGRAVVLLRPHLERAVELGQQLLRHLFGLQRRLRGVGIQAFEHDHEFVAPETGHGIGGAHALLQPLRHLHEQAVPHVVAEGVVEVLEVVQVDEKQRAQLLVALAGGTGPLQAVQQQAPVRQPGQGIEEGQQLDLLLGLLAVGDVAAHAEQPRDMPVHVADRGLDGLEVAGIAVFGEGERFFVHHGLPCGHRPLVELAHAGGFDGGHQFLVVQADDVALAPPQVSLEDRVAGQVAPGSILEEHHVRDGVDEAREPGALLTEFQRQVLLLRHIDGEHHDRHHPPVRPGLGNDGGVEELRATPPEGRTVVEHHRPPLQGLQHMRVQGLHELRGQDFGSTPPFQLLRRAPQPLGLRRVHVEDAQVAVEPGDAPRHAAQQAGELDFMRPAQILRLPLLRHVGEDAVPDDPAAATLQQPWRGAQPYPPRRAVHAPHPHHRLPHAHRAVGDLIRLGLGRPVFGIDAVEQALRVLHDVGGAHPHQPLQRFAHVDEPATAVRLADHLVEHAVGQVAAEQLQARLAFAQAGLRFPQPGIGHADTGDEHRLEQQGVAHHVQGVRQHPGPMEPVRRQRHQELRRRHRHRGSSHGAAPAVARHRRVRAALTHAIEQAGGQDHDRAGHQRGDTHRRMARSDQPVAGAVHRGRPDDDQGQQGRQQGPGHAGTCGRSAHREQEQRHRLHAVPPEGEIVRNRHLRVLAHPERLVRQDPVEEIADGSGRQAHHQDVGAALRALVQHVQRHRNGQHADQHRHHVQELLDAMGAVQPRAQQLHDGGEHRRHAGHHQHGGDRRAFGKQGAAEGAGRRRAEQAHGKGRSGRL